MFYYHHNLLFLFYSYFFIGLVPSVICIISVEFSHTLRTLVAAHHGVCVFMVSYLVNINSNK